MTKENTLELLLLNRQQIQENSTFALDFLKEQLNKQADETDEEVQLNLQFNNSLAQFYFYSNYQKSIEISLGVLNRYPNSVNYEATGQHYSFIGACHTFQHQFDKAEEYLNKALALAERVKDEKPLLKVAVLQSLFENNFYRKGNPDVSAAYLKEALAILQQNSDPLRISGCLLQLGAHYFEQGDCNTALSYYYKAAVGFEENLHLNNMAIVHSGIGMCYLKQGKPEAAESSVLKALSLCGKAATPDNIAWCNYNLAQVYVAKKEWDKARDHAQNSRSVFENTGNSIQLKEAEKLLAEIEDRLMTA